MSSFSLASRYNDGLPVNRSADPAAVFKNWKGTNERWLFIAPHDDDMVLGAGLLLQLAVECNIPVEIIITTDGQMGYCQPEQMANIQGIRRSETFACYGALGIDAIDWLDFPDCDLMNWGGRRKARSGTSPHQIAGFTGLQNSYTWAIRRFHPTRVFLPTGNDLHTDHKMVYQELLVSVFHSVGDIWPELGKPMKEVPEVYEMGIYCDFPAPPNVQISGTDEHLEKKLLGILAYQSQKQIEKLVENVKKSGSVEYFRDLAFDLYQPEKHEARFEP